LGSTRKVIKIGETVTNKSYTPPSLIKATPTSITSNSDDVTTASVSKDGDVMMTSSSQKGKLLKKNSITSNKDPPDGRTNRKRYLAEPDIIEYDKINKPQL
jgi:hypothetical protein